ncbi:GntR family transcriptional regulator [Micromonospora vinacea]|uniref:GntR family transcriptional regulator n=1 Tax=Micromonospora vinacea TaxID=709878 RepID=UPI00344B5C1E
MPTPHYGQPRYRAIADALRERIASGAIPPGALLPTESALTTEFRASRGTIRQAIAVLRGEGLVATEHGRGTYTNPRWQESRPDEDSQTKIRERRIAADPGLATLFDVEVGADLIEQEIVVTEDGTVGEVVRTYRLRVQQ